MNLAPTFSILMVIELNRMSESKTHLNLVSELHKRLQLLAEHEGDIRISVDSGCIPTANYPPGIDGFTPDIFIEDFRGNALIIGEAKTSIDLISNRTKQQLSSFLRFAHRRRIVLYLAVSLPVRNTAHNLLNCLAKGIPDFSGRWSIFTPGWD